MQNEKQILADEVVRQCKRITIRNVLSLGCLAIAAAAVSTGAAWLAFNLVSSRTMAIGITLIVAAALGKLILAIGERLTVRAGMMLAYFGNDVADPFADLPVPLVFTSQWIEPSKCIIARSFKLAPLLVLMEVGPNGERVEVRFSTIELYKKFERAAKNTIADVETVIPNTFSMPAVALLRKYFKSCSPDKWGDLCVPALEDPRDEPEFRAAIRTILENERIHRRYDLRNALIDSAMERIKIPYQSETDKAVTRGLIRMAESLAEPPVKVEETNEKEKFACTDCAGHHGRLPTIFE